MTLETQEDIDVKMEHKSNALYDMVQSSGDKLQNLKTRLQLNCHADDERICVTSFVYDKSDIGQERVKAHLQGIWHDSTESLDLAKLHQEILDLKKAKNGF